MKVKNRVILLWTTLAMGHVLLAETNRESNLTDGIRASVLADGRSSYILWQPPQKEGEVIIARSNSVIDTQDKLFIADSLGRFPSGGKNGISQYYDYNLKPGLYYYAIVLVEDVRKRQVKLVSGRNYSTEPVRITTESQEPGNQSPQAPGVYVAQDKQVNSLTASKEGTAVRLEWAPPYNPISGRTVYSIYRSPKSLSSPSLMREAEKLSEVSHPITTFLDQDLSRSQTVYYGVSVREFENETLPLVQGRSFLRVFYIKNPKSGDVQVISEAPTNPGSGNAPPLPTTVPLGKMNAGAIFTVQGIGYEKKGKGIEIRWNPPDEADTTTQYTVYASTKSFEKDSESFVGSQVLKLGVVSHPKTTFLIKEIRDAENLYFAVTAKSSSHSEDFHTKELLTYFQYSPDKNLEITNEDPIEETPQTSVSEPLKSPQLTPTPQAPESTDMEPEEFQTAYNYDVSKSELERILANEYASKRYYSAAQKLTEFSNNETHKDLRGKAYFFTGISYFKLGNISKAQNFFLRQETREYNKERADFWIQKCLRSGKKGDST